MANLSLSLTDSACARAEPKEREYALRDTRQPGLTLRVQPCGARSWVVRNRVGGKLVRHQLGSFPETGVKAARRIAAALIARDAEAPPPVSTAPLFEVFQAEHETRCGAFYKPEGLRSYRSYVRCELLPAFSGKRLDAITRQDVLRWFEGYSARKPGGANRALGILGQMFGRAKAWGHVPKGWANPVTGIRMNRRKVVGSFLSEEQMTRLGDVLDTRMAEGCTASALLRFLTLTGCRVSEAVSLQWGDVLPDRLRLRDSKTGPRDVPLGAPVRRFLRAYRARLRPAFRAAARPVFPLPYRQNCWQVKRAWLSIKTEADLPAKLRIHDLRHSFASHAVMSGETLFTTSRLLGHARVQMTARYAHLADTALLATAEKIGRLLMDQAERRGERSIG